MPAEQRGRLQRRMAGAEPFALHHHFTRRDSVFKRRHIRPNHHHNASKNLFASADQMLDHGPPRQGMQHLGLGGTHARSKAGGEDDGGGAHGSGGNGQRALRPEAG